MSDQTNNSGADPQNSEQAQNTAPQEQSQSQNQNTQDRDTSQPPIRTIRDGDISASVWEKQREDGPFYSAKVVRKWRDEEGRFHESNNYSEYDLKRLGDVARNTGDVINGLRREQTQSQEQSGRDNAREEFVQERQIQRPAQNISQTRKQNDW